MTTEQKGARSTGSSIDLYGFNTFDHTFFDLPDNWPQPQNQEIGELTAPLLSLVKDLLPNIKNGDYTLLVGDDTSGRIPTLILRQVINHVYKQNGIEPIPTIFYSQYGAGECEEAFLNTIAKANQSKTGGKALVSTEYIWKGNAIGDVGAYLKENNADFDIATVSSLQNREEVEGTQPLRDFLTSGTNLFIGTSNPDCPRIYQAEQLTGITRRLVFRRVLPQHRETVKTARQDVNLVADFLISQI